MPDSQFYHIAADGVLNQTNTVEEALYRTEKDGFLWLNYNQPAKEDLSSLIGLLGLHPLAIEDCIDANQIPKMEDFLDNTFIIFNAFGYFNDTLFVEEIDLFIGRKFLVTVSGECKDDKCTLYDIEGLVRRNPVNTAKGPEFLMHIILDHIVDEKFHAIEILESKLNDAEETVIADASEFNPAELLQLRRDLLIYRKSLFHEREILVKICRRDCPYISDDAIFHYRDIYDHLARFFELTEAYHDIVTSLMELYMSMLNNKMTKTANETNFTMKRLTMITTIFMPLSLLAGIGGMSEWSMMTGAENWKISYPLFMLGLAVIGIINYYLLIKTDGKK
ncbi:MAG: magnesium transporter CorA family protein [Armatimonadota bacterium]